MMSVSPGAMTVMMFLRDDALSQLGESLSGIRDVESLRCGAWERRAAAGPAQHGGLCNRVYREPAAARVRLALAQLACGHERPLDPGQARLLQPRACLGDALKAS
eukprot:scaffold90120_cov78-Phaeocystis_antarctica.AAC.1